MMDLKGLMAGMAVVIDDALHLEGVGEAYGRVDDVNEVDDINEIVTLFETEWRTPFYRSSEMPPVEVWDNLLTSASFVLLTGSYGRDGERAGEARHREESGVPGAGQRLLRPRSYLHQ